MKIFVSRTNIVSQGRRQQWLLELMMTRMDDVYNATREKFEGMVTIQLVLLNLRYIIYDRRNRKKINGKSRENYFLC